MPPGRTGGGPGGGRRIVAGNIVYKFTIELDDSVQAMVQAHVRHAERLLKEIKDLNKEYSKVRQEGEGGFKALNLAVASFFALMIANSSTTRDMFGAIFSSLGSVMDSVAVIFLPLVTKLLDGFNKLAVHIFDITSGAQGMEGAFRNLGTLVGDAVMSLGSMALKFVFDLAITGVPNINRGIEDAVKDLPPGLRELAALSIETAAYGMVAKMTNKGLQKLGVTKGPLSGGAAMAIGLGIAEGGMLLEALQGDEKSGGMLAIGGGVGLATLLATKNPRAAIAAGLGGEIGAGALFDIARPEDEAARYNVPAPVMPPTPTGGGAPFGDMTPPAGVSTESLGLRVDKVEASATVPVTINTTYNVSPSMNLEVKAGSGATVNNVNTDASTTTGP